MQTRGGLRKPLLHLVATLPTIRAPSRQVRGWLTPTNTRMFPLRLFEQRT